MWTDKWFATDKLSCHAWLSNMLNFIFLSRHKPRTHPSVLCSKSRLSSDLQQISHTSNSLMSLPADPKPQTHALWPVSSYVIAHVWRQNCILGGPSELVKTIWSRGYQVIEYQSGGSGRNRMSSIGNYRFIIVFRQFGNLIGGWRKDVRSEENLIFDLQHSQQDILYCLCPCVCANVRYSGKALLWLGPLCAQAFVYLPFAKWNNSTM